MTGILADNDVEGDVDILIQIWQRDDWRDIWLGLNLPRQTFEDLELARSVSDATLWHVCQQKQVVMITANRKAKGPHSLEDTIRLHNTPTCLPVFTLANRDRIRNSRAYAERVAERLLQYLLEIDNLRGTGRLYLP